MEIKLSEGVVPINKVPIIIKNRLGGIVKVLCDKGMIKPVNELLEWANNIVIIEKPNKTLKIYIDTN